MKKLTLLAFTFLTLFLGSVEAQQIKRCITEEKMQELFSRDPQAKLRYENTRRQLDDKVREYMNNPAARMFKTTAIVNVPVVVHIILPDPNVVTNAMVQKQLDTLNWYYGAAPAGDSLRVYEPFRTTYARSQIRFCLAQRTDDNLATNGIVRITSNEDFSMNSSHPSTVAGAWNTQKYMNMWVVNFGLSGTLGYSYKPGSWPPGHQNIGYVVDYRAFGSGPSESQGGYHYENYNGGKTAVHEIGHFFNLDHTWGPNNSGNPTCTLSDQCADTPPTDGPFFGCPSSFPVTNSCSPTAPGIMWQNHMDYADDRCMILFTANQVTRMETALNNAPDRNTLVTSNGCQPLVALPNDAGISAVVTPANGSDHCSSSIIPVVTLKNYGSNTLTSVTITPSVNGSPQAPSAWTGSLAAGATVNLTLNALTLTLGNNNLSFSTSSPNGVADAIPANDHQSSVVNYLSTLSLPIAEGFEAAGFPPPGWVVANPNNDAVKWLRKNVGRNSTASMWIDNFTDDATNTIDEFRSSAISTTGVTTLNISFDLAHKNYPDADFHDTLTVLVSGDCGASYQTVYKKWGPALATAGSANTNYLNPAASDWRSELISINGPILSNPSVVVVFRNTSRWGNNIYIDNINIQKQSQRDIRMVSINNPGATACSPIVTPSVTILNSGAETITSFDVGYRIDNGTIINTSFTGQNLAPGASITVPLVQSGAIATGNKTITAFTFNATSGTGTGDITTSNDTITKGFTVVNLVSPPLVEGFEVFFPPANWQIINPDGANTWTRRQPGRNSNYAAFIDNFTNVAQDETDDIKSPFINVAGSDSLIIHFDLAHKYYPNLNYYDTLSVLVSTDCGNNYTRIYQKWGPNLATAGSSVTAYTTAAAGDWRTERIAVGGALVSNGSVNVIIRNTNQEGNNIFIDNINIATLFKRDITVSNINQPSAIICDGNITPGVTIRNVGTETISSVKLNYQVDNGAIQTATFNGLGLQRDEQATLNLPASNVTGTGAHTIRIYSTDPVSINGTGDHYFANDTLSLNFYIAGSVSAPLTEAFSGTSFPPANWSLINPDGGITWSQHASGNGTPGSAYVNTFNYNVIGQKDYLVTPNVNYTGVDSVKLRFDVAAAIFSYPGNPTLPVDTLEVLVSKDCGNSFTSVYKKWGDELQTVIYPSTTPTQFFPTASSQWRNETIDLTGFGGSGPMMVFFRTTNNFENNIFIDNVNLTTRVLPDRLKQQGYMILPSPFTHSFNVWHVQPPTKLRYINVYTATGQLVYKREFSGNAANVQTVNLRGKAAGVYIVKLGYDDREVTERILKL
ncbi:MAG TPA: choice-of-anchor J domain-containing protein [Flavisolibacter sp.]